jgi:PAS domain S-box-containing protein
MKNEEKTKDQPIKEVEKMQQELAALQGSVGQKGFQAFADLLPEVIFETDPKGRIRFSNTRGFQLTGYSPKDLSNGLHVLDLCIPEDRARARENIASVAAMEDVGLTEYTVRRKDGSTFPAMVCSCPIIHDQSVIGLRGILMDLSDRKKIEETLRIKESAIESSITAIVMADLEANLTYVNKAFLTMWGYETEQEILGKNAVEFWQEKEEARAVADALKETDVWVGELIAKRRDGSAFDVHLSTSVVNDGAGSPLCLMASFIDISSSKRAEEALKKENEKLLVIMEHAPLGISLYDEAGHCQYINPKFVEMFGYTREDILIGREFFHKAFPDKAYRDTVIAAWISEHVHGRRGEARSRTFTVHRKDGSEKIIHFRPVTLETGQELTICEDITERQETEDSLKKREAELEIKTKTLEEMNAALRVLLRKRDEDKKERDEAVLFNVNELVFPFLEKLKKSPLDSKEAAYVSILEANLNNICSPFTRALSTTYLGLTPTEIQIASLIKEGRTTKEIAEVMSLSPRTVDAHRDNIRRKIGIKNKKANLRSHLLSLL